MKYLSRIILFSCGFLLMLNDGMAQCAMCKAVAEDAASNSAYGIWSGLNMGIIFLMGFPYICLGVIVYVFFRKSIKGFIRSFNAIHK